jgi:hypothetical protein
VSRFVITITPENANSDDAASAQTTVRVDTSTGHTRITELTVRAADGGGLAPEDLPAVDLDLLIRALGARSAIRALPTDSEAEDSVAVVHLPTPTELAEQVEPAEVAAEPTGTAPAGGTTRATGGRRAAKRAAGRAAIGRARGGRAAKKAAERAPAGTESGTRTGRKASGTAAAARRKAAAGEERQTRAYRRMPEPAEVLDVYAQTGSITRLAEHFGVPRHTANGWARRLRQQGYAIGRS